MDDARNLHQDLEAAAKWEQDWLTCFHPDKCNSMSVAQEQNPIQFEYKLHGQQIQQNI